MRVLVVSQFCPTRLHPPQTPDNRPLFDELARTHDALIVRPVGVHRLVKAVAGACSGSRMTSAELPKMVCPIYPEPKSVWSLTSLRRFDASVRAAAREAARQFQPDVILANWEYPEGWSAVRLAREIDVPVVLKVYSHANATSSVTDAAQSHVVEVLHTADAVIAADRAAARAVVTRGTPRRLVRIIPDGVVRRGPSTRSVIEARRMLGLERGGLVVVCVGDSRLRTGAADLLKACAILKQRGVSVTCCLIGAQLDSRPLRRLVRSRGLEANVLFAAASSEEERLTWLDACDLVVYPAYADHLICVLREAIEHCRPFVATRVGGIRDLFDPAMGRLVLAGDVGHLADAMGDLLERPPGATQVAERVNVSWTESATLVTDCLQDAVRRRAVAAERRRRRTAHAQREPGAGLRLDTGADVDTLRRLAGVKRSR
ncbi:MAG: glycosyltransferase [Vicinamibacterales bacterium]